LIIFFSKNYLFSFFLLKGDPKPRKNSGEPMQIPQKFEEPWETLEMPRRSRRFCRIFSNLNPWKNVYHNRRPPEKFVRYDIVGDAESFIMRGRVSKIMCATFNHPPCRIWKTSYFSFPLHRLHGILLREKTSVSVNFFAVERICFRVSTL
jgi:hypothetical protein